jgi:hypothetical protein
MLRGPRRRNAGWRAKAIQDRFHRFVRARARACDDRARARTSEWCTLTSEEEDKLRVSPKAKSYRSYELVNHMHQSALFEGRAGC